MDMKFLPGGNSNSEVPSIIKNPFLKHCVTRIWIDGNNTWQKKWLWKANVEFKNGNTSGSHKTKEYEDIDAMFAELKTTLEQLKNG